MRPPEWPAFPAAERFAQLYRPGAVLGDRGGAVECARHRADASRVPASTSTACRCSTSARKARPTSSAIALWAPSRCRSRRSAARCSTAWLRRGGRDRQAHAGPRPRAGRQPQAIRNEPRSRQGRRTAGAPSRSGWSRRTTPARPTTSLRSVGRRDRPRLLRAAGRRRAHRSTGGRSTSTGATSAACPTTTSTPTTAWPARPCSTGWRGQRHLPHALRRGPRRVPAARR